MDEALLRANQQRLIYRPGGMCPLHSGEEETDAGHPPLVKTGAIPCFHTSEFNDVESIIGNRLWFWFPVLPLFSNEEMD